MDGKLDSFCDEIEKFGKGMGNASRYRIVEALFGGKKTVGELVKLVKLSQPAVSQHLKTLKHSNIVKDARVGQEVFYEINTKHVLTLLNDLTTKMQKEKVHSK